MAMTELCRRVPIMVQASFDVKNGQQMLAGSDPGAFVATFEPYSEVEVLGLNCAFGPYDLAESTRFIARTGHVCVRSAECGLPVMVDVSRISR